MRAKVKHLKINSNPFAGTIRHNGVIWIENHAPDYSFAAVFSRQRSSLWRDATVLVTLPQNIAPPYFLEQFSLHNWGWYTSIAQVISTNVSLTYPSTVDFQPSHALFQSRLRRMVLEYGRSTGTVSGKPEPGNSGVLAQSAS